MENHTTQPPTTSIKIQDTPGYSQHIDIHLKQS